MAAIASRILFTLAAVFAARLASAQIPAFPGAEGAGKFTRGGRGGKVVAVTNLNDSGPGSLRAAIETAEPRTVVFHVSGTIALKSRIRITQPFLTIAGQTAPGDGICLSRYPLEIAADQVIVRHIRSRSSDEAFHEGGGTGEGMDSLSVIGGTHIVIDHCSTSWSVDENLSTSVQPRGPKIDKVTVQWCIIGESLNRSVHTSPAAHGYGTLAKGGYGAEYSYHHNLYVHNNSRNPYPGNYNDVSVDPQGLTFDFRNNVIYNWMNPYAGYNTQGGANSVTRMNFIGNYYKPGPNSGGRYAFFQRVLASRGYFHGNIMADAHPEDPWSLVMWDPKWTPEQIAAFKLKAPTPVSAVPPDEGAATAFHRVLGEAGATRPKRDPIDTRLINDVSKGSGRIIDDEAEVGGWPELKSAPAPADKDKDGMPDAWEMARRLDMDDPTDGSGDRDGDGYTNLEEYLNELAAGRSGELASAETAPGKLPPTMHDRVGTEPGAKGAKYVLHVPQDYAAEKIYPLVVFLHGSQVYGTDGRRQLTTGLPSYMRKDPEYLKQHDAALRQTLIVFPQSRSRSFFLGDDAELVMAIVRDVQQHYRVDPKRIYLTGLSMGGYGVWNMAIRYPDAWAAIAPICGAGEPAKASGIKAVPCWVWHGDKDDRVPVQLARDMVAALRAAGGNPKYTELPRVGHGSYGPAYKSQEFWSWLLGQRKL